MQEENIAAIATAAGRGGVAIIRVSGKTALALAAKMFKPVAKINVEDFEPYKMYAGKISVKIKTEYNKDAQADYSFKDLSTFLTNNENTEKLLNEFIQ